MEFWVPGRIAAARASARQAMRCCLSAWPGKTSKPLSTAVSKKSWSHPRTATTPSKTSKPGIYGEYSRWFISLSISSSPLEQGRLELHHQGVQERKWPGHDPCYLGRHNGIYDEPREALQKIPGLELIQMADSLADSLCCGGGSRQDVWMETVQEVKIFSDLRVSAGG